MSDVNLSLQPKKRYSQTDQFDPLEQIQSGHIGVTHGDCAGGSVLLTTNQESREYVKFECSVCGEHGSFLRKEFIQALRRLLTGCRDSESVYIKESPGGSCWYARMRVQFPVSQGATQEPE